MWASKAGGGSPMCSRCSLCSPVDKRRSKRLERVFVSLALPAGLEEIETVVRIGFGWLLMLAECSYRACYFGAGSFCCDVVFYSFVVPVPLRFRWVLRP